MDKKDKPEPSFPAPYEPFNEELAFDIQELRQSLKDYEVTKNSVAKSTENLKNVSFDHHDFRNREKTVLYHEERLRILEEKIQHHEKMTFGRMQDILKEHEADPQLTQEVMQVLDEKVYQEKYDNRSPNEDKQINETNKENTLDDSKTLFSENRKDMRIESDVNSSSSKNDYTLSLIREKREEKERIQSELREKTTMDKNPVEIEKETIPNAGYLNYQLKYTISAPKENVKQDKDVDLAKKREDKSLDKD